MSALSPMLASPGTALPRDPGWVFEPKYDGIRILAFATSKDVALVSRNGLDKTAQFPEIADALRARRARVRRPFVLDGEVVAMEDDEPARFQQLQGRVHINDHAAIHEYRLEAPTAFMAFDMLLDGGTSLVTEPWRVRRKHLTALLQPPGSNALRLSDVGRDGAAMLRAARQRGWEGIIAKRADAPYHAGHRSRDWRKLKIERQQEFVVGGWTEPRKTREHFGALLLGYYDADGRLIYAGHTGTGFARAALADLYPRLRRLERTRSPFSTTPRTNERAHWIRPDIIVEIKFNEWTTGGRLRQPVFLGVRDDKAPRDVRREVVPDVTSDLPRNSKRTATGRRPMHRALGNIDDIAAQLREIEAAGGSGVLETADGPLALSNLDKIFFPKTAHTKGDIMRYYAQMSHVVLPAIADRPLVMKRFPNGVGGKAFYQQRAPADAPAAVHIEPVADEGLTTQRRLIGGGLATLLYLVQLGAISVDPWHSRIGSIPFADYAIIDLDPGPRAPFGRVVDVALAVKEVLDAFGLHAVPKTSGASGMHIVLPLPPDVPNEGARMLAELVATTVAEQHPRIATIERRVGARAKGAIYVDYLQNIRGKTVAGVYSVRARPTPTVSTPLRWTEVDDRLDPTAFTIDTVPARVDALGDLWAAGMRRPNSLKGVTGGA